MKKFFLGVFILFDLSLMAASGFVLYAHVTSNGSKRLISIAKMTTHAVGLTPLVPVASSGTVPSSPGVITSNPSAASQTADTSMRKILFTYRSPHVKQVSIRADFTGWKAEPMQKGANGAWTYQAQLTPGEYAYCYTADDKTFKDPANKRTKQIGRTLVSAILVEPLPAKPSK